MIPKYILHSLHCSHTQLLVCIYKLHHHHDILEGFAGEAGHCGVGRGVSEGQEQHHLLVLRAAEEVTEGGAAVEGRGGEGDQTGVLRARGGR